MTTAQIAAYYASLLIKQYKGKTRANAHIQAMITPLLMGQIPQALQIGFDSTTAVGPQLDILGKYVGVSRSGTTTSGSNITLVDADFRTLILFAIIKNSTRSSLYEIQKAINGFFGTNILVFDYMNMQMSYLVSSAVGSYNLIQMLSTQSLLPRPNCVSLSLVYATTINNFFGFRTYVINTTNNTPFNSYTSYSYTSPWLSYKNLIT